MRWKELFCEIKNLLLLLTTERIQIFLDLEGKLNVKTYFNNSDGQW